MCVCVCTMTVMVFLCVHTYEGNFFLYQVSSGETNNVECRVRGCVAGSKCSVAVGSTYISPGWINIIVCKQRQKVVRCGEFFVLVTSASC